MPGGTIPFPERFLKITPVYSEMALEARHLHRE
jgi:hypothetical protein